MNDTNENLSELRQDIVSGDWVTVATGRARRPNDFVNAPHKKFSQSKKECPFEHIEEKDILLSVPDEKPFVRVVKNKYPAFAEGLCEEPRADGIYTYVSGIGGHEVVVTGDHERSFAEFTGEEAAYVIKAYRERFHALKTNGCVRYISIFHNHGPESGATITHPHSQIIAIPVIPPDIRRSLGGAESYFQRNGRCVHCDVLNFEQNAMVRKVYENEHFVAVCPYASKTAFEIRIFPKVHSPEFQMISPSEITTLGSALQKIVYKLWKGLGDPSYNFFIHTAPSFDHMTYPNYHWHIEILPKTAIWAGFEIGTGIEISTITPEAAAEFLREI
jgi:UDPglucose--hexose-1-phosphate uridylyltransferase